MNKKSSLLLLLILCLLLGKTSFAQEKRGFVFLPTISYSSMYATNFDFSQTNPNDEFLHIVSPSLSLNYKGSKLTADNRYSFFFIQSQETPDYQRFHHRLQHQSRYVISPKTFLTLEENLAFIDDPNYVQRGFFIGRNQYLQNTLTPGVFHLLSKKTRAGLSYYNYLLNFTDSDVNDVLIQGGTARVEYFLSSKNQFGIYYTNRIADFKIGQTNDYFDNIGSVQWRHQFTKKLSGIASGGVQHRHYSDDVLSDILDGVGQLQVSYTTPRQTKIELSSKYGRNNLAADTSFYIISTDLNARYRLRPRLYLGGLFYHQYANYSQPAGISSQLVGFSPSIQYKMRKWFYFEGQYDVQKNSSNLSNTGYLAQTFQLKIGAFYGKNDESI